MKRILLILLISSFYNLGFTQSLGSLTSIDQIFQMYASDMEGGAADAKRYLEGYMAPAVNGLGFGASGGWYNSAETHKPGGFDITATVTMAVVPDVDRAFSMADANTVDVVGSTDVPSLMGSDVAPEFALKSDPNTTFQGLGGFGTGMENAIGYVVVPTPMAQIGVGLPKNTEVKLRYIPKVNAKGLDLNMYGIGVMHNIKQYIPGVKLAPFDLSVFVGYNKMKLRTEFQSARTNNGELFFGFDSFNYQAIISKKMSILTVYAGIGASNTKLNLQVNGEVDIDQNTSNGYELQDPIDLDINTFGSKMSLGFRLKLAVITLHADYTLQKYNALTVGVGVSIR